ncbi:MAG TPA: tetratricopeptide repeat protein [Candidatus Hydrogenedentes bacterium]|nr:tetratricopeptide repeat protein [Candidatus Hydrogenedentota bacterium]HOJ69203.1 tetratricopeptide repeat protein [Candidatus Hydrogenedentota bacterium]HOK88608.1 tetratricopeptide repeat protein [Candidatus Hydrogenedentota bacterium]HPO30839.1 tetratricopeptide repeat protein [Candidatus Hydrogenedentota bacterium]
MARPRKTSHRLQDVEQEVSKPVTDLERLYKHVLENPWLYVGGVVFVIVCVLAGIAAQAVTRNNAARSAEEYVRAALKEDPAARMDMLAAAAENAGKWSDETLYLAGEAALEAENYEKAREFFNTLCEKYPRSIYVPRAKDGLAFIEEGQGNVAQALESYKKLVLDFPTDYLVQLRWYDIGRLQEKAGNLQEAVESYRRQTEVFPETTAARRAQGALDRLKKDHPDLFPEEQKPAAEASSPEAKVTTPENTVAPPDSGNGTQPATPAAQ